MFEGGGIRCEVGWGFYYLRRIFGTRDGYRDLWRSRVISDELERSGFGRGSCRCQDSLLGFIARKFRESFRKS